MNLFRVWRRRISDIPSVTTNAMTLAMKPRNTKKIHKGTMLSTPLSDWLTYVNVAYLVSLALTLALSVSLWRVSIAIQYESGVELQRYKDAAAVKVSEANKIADEARREAAKANVTAAESISRAAALESSAAEATRQTSVLNLQLERERLSRINLQRQFAWRVISREDASALITRLSLVKSSILVAYMANDQESLYLAIQLTRILQAAGWTVTPESRTYSTRLIFGIQVQSSTNNSTKEFKAAIGDLAGSVSESDLPPPDLAFTFQGSSEVTILIGSRMPPSLNDH
jgi:hypothetical protein